MFGTSMVVMLRVVLSSPARSLSFAAGPLTFPSGARPSTKTAPRRAASRLACSRVPTPRGPRITTRGGGCGPRERGSRRILVSIWLQAASSPFSVSMRWMRSLYVSRATSQWQLCRRSFCSSASGGVYAPSISPLRIACWRFRIPSTSACRTSTWVGTTECSFRKVAWKRVRGKPLSTQPFIWSWHCFMRSMTRCATFSSSL
mmetsp:Transcript_52093/g.137623  ORF Transcript_52093/g.137623 Transcript_52093/m.137623 type:complete len:202 (+) Transcript_52093:495-1100(+)